VRYDDPTRLFVELWRDTEIISTHYCASADDVTREADRLFDDWCPPADAGRPDQSRSRMSGD